MRTIKFRGKSLDNGEWVYGFFSKGGAVNPNMGEIRDRYLIDDGHYHDVDPDTIGQFTGLADKDGKEIYEGDIVETFIGNLEIIWSQGLACYRLQDGGGSLYSIDGMEMEVVGNIHDNPELLTE